MDDAIAINVLVELAGLEDEAATARATLERSARRTVDLQALQVELDADAAAAAEAGRTTEAAFRRHALEMERVEARLRERRDLLIGLSDRRQHRAVSEEIGALERERDRLETEAIGLLERADGERAATVASDREARRSVTAAGDERRGLSARAAQAAAALEEIEAEGARLLKMLPPAVTRHVERLRRSGGRSTVFLAAGACGGCGGILPAQQGLAVDKGTLLVRCPSCSRYLVHRPWR